MSLPNEDAVLDVLQTVVGKGLSVRETEGFVKKYIAALNSVDKETDVKTAPDNAKIYIASLEEKVSSKLGRKAFISNSKKDPKRGKLEIEYYGSEDLEALLKTLCGNDIFM